MARRRQPELSWLTAYPIDREAQGWSPDRPLFVDIGGSIGHQCANFKAAHPNIPGRVILQDLPHSVANALPTPGVENMAHDFWTPQPIRGSKLYYTRTVLHNHPDHRSRELLEITKEAMTPDSMLLIDEMILPDTGVNVQTTSINLTMMVACAARERTVKDWTELIESAGLKLVKIYSYNPGSYESVMVVFLESTLRTLVELSCPGRRIFNFSQ
ncbi:hypothetical protein OQA88_1475 [Cercophora sp. LCS_1]